MNPSAGQSLPVLPKSLSQYVNSTAHEKLKDGKAVYPEPILGPKANFKSDKRLGRIDSQHEIMVDFPPKSNTRSSARLDDSLARLRKEMIDLRQLDVQLLHQLWNLNESIQEYKLMSERSNSFSETNSECSCGYENGLDSISDHDEDIDNCHGDNIGSPSLPGRHTDSGFSTPSTSASSSGRSIGQTCTAPGGEIKQVRFERGVSSTHGRLVTSNIPPLEQSTKIFKAARVWKQTKC